MKHYIKIAAGISKGYIKYSEDTKKVIISGIIMLLLGPIGGVGQGGGASPIIWLAVLLIMLEAYKKTNEGITIINLITRVKIAYWIISYVDDNTILKRFPRNTTTTLIIKEMKKSLLVPD